MSNVLPAGSTVSHYRIVSRLGAGGMGEVYKAQDTKLDRTVALKILPPEVVKNEDRVRRFVQEAKAASGLSHPHIVAIHEIGEEPGDGKAGLHYIAMEFVNGVTLRTKIHDVNTNLRDLLEHLAQAADALAKAHAAGIIHRDLKPDNIMVTQDGYAKVLDFGLAKLTERASGGSGAATAVREQTRDGVVVGTIGYMSPEQVKGQPVDYRSDIFSLGCILYEAATKQKAFAADSDVDVMHKIIHDEPQSVSQINPKVPAELRRMIRRCLAKDPDRRYQSMKDIAIELRDLAQEFETLTPSGSTSAPSAILPRPRWHTPVMAIGIVFVLAIVTLLVLRPFRQLSRTPASIQMTFTQLTDYAGPESTPRFSPDGTFIVFVRGTFQGRERDIYLQRIGGQKPINLTDAPSDDYQPAISPDGQLIAFRSARQGGGIFTMGATGESVKRLTDFGFDPAWSPDGKEIVVATEGPEMPLARSTFSQLWRVQYPSGERKLISKTDAVQPSWSPHGHRIAYWGRPSAGGQRDIWTIPAAGGDAIAVTNDLALDWNPVWSPDGNYLYFSSDRAGSMNLWRIAIDERTGKLLGAPEAITTPAPWAGRLDISRDGRRIVFTSEDTQSRVQRVSLDHAGNIVGSPQAVTSVSFRIQGVDVSPDGKQLTFWSSAGHEDIYVAQSDGTEIRKLTDDSARDRGPRWSPDGKQIAFFSDRSSRYEIWVANSESGDLRQVTTTAGNNVWFPIWSPDGTKLAVANEFGSYFLDLSGKLPVSQLEPLPPFSKEETFEATDWSPDGKWLTGGRRRNGETQPGVVLYSIERSAYKKLTDVGGRSVWFKDNRRILFRHKGQFFSVDRVSREVRQISRFDQPSSGSFLSLPRDNRTLFFQDSNTEADIWMLTIK